MAIGIHPAIEHIADKGYERMTLDEAAIVHSMRRSLNQSFADAEMIRIWLQQLNPLGLNGPELSEWALEVSDWVLPTQLRRSRAATTGIKQDGDQQQREEGAPGRQASEASGGHSFTERREGEVPYIAEAE